MLKCPVGDGAEIMNGESTIALVKHAFDEK